MGQSDPVLIHISCKHEVHLFYIVLKLLSLHKRSSTSFIKLGLNEKNNQETKSFCAQKSFSSSFPRSLRGIKRFSLECQQTALSNKQCSEWITISFPLPVFSHIFLLSVLWWATEPFLWLCMHHQTCWYDLKGHVLFTLTEAFQNFDEGVPLKNSSVAAVAAAAAAAAPQLEAKLINALHQKPFFPIQAAFPGVVMLNQDGPSAAALPQSYSLRCKRINWLSLMSSSWVHFWNCYAIQSCKIS